MSSRSEIDAVYAQKVRLQDALLRILAQCFVPAPLGPKRPRKTRFSDVTLDDMELDLRSRVYAPQEIHTK